MKNLNFNETIDELFTVASYKVEPSDTPDAGNV
jgi:hypothetical protein